jgi:colanic acid/amylovoran biosynthesis protein
LSPQTIGPFKSSVTRILAKQVMRRCRMIFARDNLSGKYLRDLQMRGNIAESTDVAFKLPFVRRAHAGLKIKFGLNISGLLFSGGYTRKNQFGLTIDYPAAMRQLLVELGRLPDVEVHLISHVIEPHMPVEDDVYACAELAKEFPDVILAPVFERPTHAKSYIAGMDFFVGARMHACIAAFSAGVPVVPVAYSRKFNGLFGVLGYRVLADGKAITNAELVETVLRAFSERATLRVDVERGVALAQQRLAAYEDVLSAELSRIRPSAQHAA